MATTDRIVAERIDAITCAANELANEIYNLQHQLTTAKRYVPVDSNVTDTLARVRNADIVHASSEAGFVLVNIPTALWDEIEAVHERGLVIEEPDQLQCSRCGDWDYTDRVTIVCANCQGLQESGADVILAELDRKVQHLRAVGAPSSLAIARRDAVRKAFDRIGLLDGRN